MSSSSGPAGDTRQTASTGVADAMLGIALAALWADGREHPAEVGVLSQEIDRLDTFDHLTTDRLMRLAADLRGTYAEDGVDTYLRERAQVLDAAQRVQALTLATDVILADREVTDEELAFLATLRGHLGVPEEQAEQIVEVLETKHGLALAVTDIPREGEDDDRFIVPSEASVALAVGAARAARLDDPSPDRETLAPLRARGKVSEATFDALVRRAEHRLDEGDAGAYLEACADRLDENEREHAFAWAADIALADRRLTDPEHSYLTEIRGLLGVEPSRASRIVDVLWAKHLR